MFKEMFLFGERNKVLPSPLVQKRRLCTSHNGRRDGSCVFNQTDVHELGSECCLPRVLRHWLFVQQALQSRTQVDVRTSP
jgi:hypothetical protein